MVCVFFDVIRKAGSYGMVLLLEKRYNENKVKIYIS